MDDWYCDLLKSDFSTFIGKTLSTIDPSAAFKPNWHIDLIAEYLEAARKGEIRRLIINLPPRSLKSVCVSVAWPAWIMGHKPESRIIAASYSSLLSLKHSLDCRLVIGSPWYRHLFPQCVIAPGQNEKHRFVTTKRGFRFSTSVGGSLTGEGGHFIIIDDPLNPLQAMSQAGRQHVNQWFDYTVFSRLDDKKSGVVALVMQRLHAKDLTGHLLSRNSWEHLAIPAIAPTRLFYRRGSVEKIMHEGELIHSKREDLELLERIKCDMGSHAFSAQYIQQPASEESSMVKSSWFRRYEECPKHFDQIIQSWDTAIKTGENNDPSVCLTFGELSGNSYLIMAQRKKIEYPDLKQWLLALASIHKPDAILIEDKSSGQQLIQDIRRESALPILPMKPIKDKITRFASVTAMIEAGKLWLPSDAPWLAEFEREIYEFPTGSHDDQVDALSQYLTWIRRATLSSLRIRSF